MINIQKTYALTPTLAEDEVWRDDVRPHLLNLPPNALDIWEFCFTEMLNNAIDHSGGKEVVVQVSRAWKNTQMILSDDGIGIFRKIQLALDLSDPRQSLLELAKGKFTTDPSKHSGQGIFFTSRMLDSFDIVSGGVNFSHMEGVEQDLVSGRPKIESEGTAVFMELSDETNRSLKEVFDEYSSGENYDFTKTVVPVVLAREGDENLVSRSQAKRLLARVDRFGSVVLDFTGVDSIGQAFADEIFRVFRLAHPSVLIIPINANADVTKMIVAVAG